MQVLSSNACKKLQLNESCESVKLGFERKFWKVSVQWNNGEIHFGKEWLNFVKAAELCVGDSLCFFQSERNLTYKVCVFHARTGCNDGGGRGLTSHLKFFKIMTKKVLKVGEFVSFVLTFGCMIE